MEPDSKRYYPYGSLASNVIGFVNAENQGGVGLEAKYESQLEGTSGLTVTAKNAKNTDLLYQYEQYYDAENGNSFGPDPGGHGTALSGKEYGEHAG